MQIKGGGGGGGRATKREKQQHASEDVVWVWGLLQTVAHN